MLKSHHKNLMFIFFVTLIIVSLGLYWGVWRNHGHNHHFSSKLNSHPTAIELQSGTAFAQARDLPVFSLVDSNNKLFSNKQLNNNWTFLFFGYSRCEGICPATLGKLTELATILGHHLHGSQDSSTQFVFITIDPQNDTVSALKNYFSNAQFKNTNFLGVTGKQNDIQTLATTIGLFVSQNNIPINGHIEHSGTVLLINPDGKLAAVLSSPNNPKAMARDLRTLMHYYEQNQNW